MASQVQPSPLPLNDLTKDSTSGDRKTVTMMLLDMNAGLTSICLAPEAPIFLAWWERARSWCSKIAAKLTLPGDYDVVSNPGRGFNSKQVDSLPYLQSFDTKHTEWPEFTPHGVSLPDVMVFWAILSGQQQLRKKFTVDYNSKDHVNYSRRPRGEAVVVWWDGLWIPVVDRYYILGGQNHTPLRWLLNRKAPSEATSGRQVLWLGLVAPSTIQMETAHIYNYADFTSEQKERIQIPRADERGLGLWMGGDRLVPLAELSYNTLTTYKGYDNASQQHYQVFTKATFFRRDILPQTRTDSGAGQSVQPMETTEPTPTPDPGQILLDGNILMQIFTCMENYINCKGQLKTAHDHLMEVAATMEPTMAHHMLCRLGLHRLESGNTTDSAEIPSGDIILAMDRLETFLTSLFQNLDSKRKLDEASHQLKQVARTASPSVFTIVNRMLAAAQDGDPSDAEISRY